MQIQGRLLTFFCRQLRSSNYLLAPLESNVSELSAQSFQAYETGRPSWHNMIHKSFPAEEPPIAVLMWYTHPDHQRLLEEIC